MSERPPISPRSPRAALEPEQLPPPPKRSDHARNPLVIIGNAIITFIVVVMIGAGGLYVYGKNKLEAPGPLAQDKVVNIPQRAGLDDIAQILKREGVIEDGWLVFAGGVMALRARTELKPGEYLFQKSASLRDVIGTIVEGKVVQHAVTIPEGLTSEQIVERLSDNPIFTGSIREIPREGTLLPETYKFPRGTPREQVIHRLQQAQKRVLSEIWERRSQDLPIKTPEQLVTLASLVEKETGKPDERTRVAAVFVNRLQKKMRLQSDPTIIYGLVGGKGTLGRPIKRSEITQPSPYNTYVIDGLPPGPIANPGRASLEAAANPARTRDLYFVADGSGGHAFSDNYEVHQKNVGKLRAQEKQLQNDTVEPPEETPPAAAAPATEPAADPAASAAPAGAPKAGKNGAQKRRARNATPNGATE
ncbi:MULTISPECIES: endolytic transglycosylase MltG [Rhodopseudomonas]|uniref:endolytic transglycosylase MltG n=1 Tax=Rhodopseudomonas TaxID=1073 RepID=UPI000D1B68BA|nr:MULTISPECIES: endolytic transglycosylase MltG [Rhodopseudomonas]AVT77180.1 aminodeoxychorismate lyase [Rhodopseudomonas palustris]AVT81985.1 aminodeoxychorismate lyase [Rhodopseudomonas palustris]NEW99291.1 endolytic transglycosylase MltG [Rhodopseudomonas sp. BR0G17]